LVDPSRLGIHGTSSGFAPGSIREAVGQVYTCKAGFIDLGHLRDLCDLTGFVFSHIATSGGAARTIIPTTHGEARLIAPVPPAEWLTVARSIAFSDSIGYEIMTYHQFMLTRPGPGGHHSSFSPEDLCSNYLGTLVAERAIQSGRPFNAAVTAELAALLRSLGALPKAGSLAAFRLINHRWVNFGGPQSLLTDGYLRRRNFTNVPWPAGHPCDAATPAFVTAPLRLSAPFYDYTHTESFRLPVSRFAAAITVVKSDARTRYGSLFATP